MVRFIAVTIEEKRVPRFAAMLLLVESMIGAYQTMRLKRSHHRRVILFPFFLVPDCIAIEISGHDGWT
jgi:hypothetical protein